MKKILAFIFSLLVGFVSFGAVKAVGGKGEIPAKAQEFGGKLIMMGRTTLMTTNGLDICNDSEYLSTQALGVALSSGFVDSHICKITCKDGTSHWVVIIPYDGQRFVCDYCKFFHDWVMDGGRIRSGAASSLFTQIDDYLRTNFRNRQISLQCKP